MALWGIKQIMINNVIEAVDLTKIYKLKGSKKEIIALNKVNLSVKEGEIFGLLGPNGAGKTTMIQIFTTLNSPTSGYAKLCGYNVQKKPVQAKNNIALMLDDKMLYNRLTAYNNLKFFCKIYNVPNYKEKIYKIVEEFGLKKWLNQYSEKFSSGMRMKLALCRTLLLERKILFLDEPTLGLDVKAIRFIVDKIRNLDATVFLTSHDMNVVEKLCDRIAFINKGEIVKIGTKGDIKKFEESIIKIYIEIDGNKSVLRNELESKSFIEEINEEDPGIIVVLKERGKYNELLSTLVKYPILRIKEIEQTLEDLFIDINQ